MLEDIGVTSLGYADLIAKIGDGTICIPDFQREFVWSRFQILNLLDSVYKKYPVGSFIFWTTDVDFKAFHKIGDIEINSLPHKEYYFVVDGQQRITTLFAAVKEAKILIKTGTVKKEKRLEILFDLDEKKFLFDDQFKERGRRKSIHWIPSVKESSFIFDVLTTVKEKSQDIFYQEHKKVNSKRRWSKIITSLSFIGLVKKEKESYNLTDLGAEILDNKNLDLLAKVLNNKYLYIKEALQVIKVNPGTNKKTMAHQFKDINEDWSTTTASIQLARRCKWFLMLGLISSARVANLGTQTIDHGYKLTDKGNRFLVSLESQEKEQELVCVPLPKILDIDLEYFNKLTPQRREAFKKVSDTFKEYKFSIITITNKDLEEVCDIFERINTGGTELNVVDLMVAKTWSTEFNLRDKLSTFKKSLKGFKELPDITILQTLSVNIQGECRRKDILSLETNDIRDNWNETLESIRKAIDFLKGNLNLHTIRILPFPALIVPLGHFYFLQGNKEPAINQKKTLIQWLWRACLSNRFDATVEAKLAEDCNVINKISKDEIAEFKYSYIPKTPPDIIDQRYSLNNAFAKTILLLYTSQRPLNPVNNMLVSSDNFSKYRAREMHHVFPVSYLKKQTKDDERTDSIANIMFLPANINKDKRFKKDPAYYLKTINNPNLHEALKTYLIGRLKDSGLLENDFDKFLEYRAIQILKQLEIESGVKGIIATERMITPETPFTNETYILETIRNCTGYIYWVDPYFTRKGMEYLSREVNSESIKEIKVLSGPKQTNPGLRKSFEKFQEEMKKRGIKAEMRIIIGDKIKSIHDRWLIDDTTTYNVPSINTIGRGQYAEISKTANRPPFEKWWLAGKDIVQEWNKIEENLKE